MRKILFYFSIILIIFFLGYYYSKSEANELRKFGIKGKAVVYKKIKTKRGTLIFYYFDVGLTKFKSSQKVYLPLSGKINIGDSIEIIFSNKTPSVNKIAKEE
jgi:hypothetical protein